MNPQKAAKAVLLEDRLPSSEQDPDGSTPEHAIWMLEGIAAGYIQHEKAHRWLGYAQALLVCNNHETLVAMKTVNRAATD